MRVHIRTVRFGAVVVRSVKWGIVVPSFVTSFGTTLDATLRAEDAGVDGVFVFDHLWPPHPPGQTNALHGPTVLAALGARTHRVRLGTLVSRVSVLPPDELVAVFTSLHAQTRGRIIAGLGLGDRVSAAENAAYGLPLPTITERLTILRGVGSALRARGVEVWFGGLSEGVRRAVADGDADAWNGWKLSPEDLGRLAPARGAATWAGLLDPAADPAVVGAQALDLAAAGAEWVVFAPVVSTQDPAAAVGHAIIQLTAARGAWRKRRY